MTMTLTKRSLMRADAGLAVAARSPCARRVDVRVLCVVGMPLRTMCSEVWRDKRPAFPRVSSRLRSSTDSARAFAVRPMVRIRVVKGVAALAMRRRFAARGRSESGLPPERVVTPLRDHVANVLGLCAGKEMVFVHAQRRIAPVAGFDERICQPEQRAAQSQHSPMLVSTSDPDVRVTAIQPTEPQPASCVGLGNRTLGGDSPRLFDRQHKGSEYKSFLTRGRL